MMEAESGRTMKKRKALEEKNKDLIRKERGNEAKNFSLLSSL